MPQVQRQLSTALQGNAEPLGQPPLCGCLQAVPSSGPVSQAAPEEEMPAGGGGTRAEPLPSRPGDCEPHASPQGVQPKPPGLLLLQLGASPLPGAFNPFLAGATVGKLSCHYLGPGGVRSTPAASGRTGEKPRPQESPPGEASSSAMQARGRPPPRLPPSRRRRAARPSGSRSGSSRSRGRCPSRRTCAPSPSSPARRAAGCRPGGPGRGERPGGGARSGRPGGAPQRQRQPASPAPARHSGGGSAFSSSSAPGRVSPSPRCGGALGAGRSGPRTPRPCPALARSLAGWLSAQRARPECSTAAGGPGRPRHSPAWQGWSSSSCPALAGLSARPSPPALPPPSLGPAPAPGPGGGGGGGRAIPGCAAPSRAGAP